MTGSHERILQSGQQHGIHKAGHLAGYLVPFTYLLEPRVLVRAPDPPLVLVLLYLDLVTTHFLIMPFRRVQIAGLLAF